MKKMYKILFGLISLIVFGIIIYLIVPFIFGSVVFPDFKEYDASITEASQTYGVDDCLIKGVILTESHGNPNAGSRAGAQGLMQLLPSTAVLVARLDPNIGYKGLSQIKDPRTNILLGTRLLRYNMDTYGSVANALIAYNAGGGAVRRFQQNGNAGIPNETRHYYPAVLSNRDSYASLKLCKGTGQLANSVSPGRSRPLPSPTQQFEEFKPVNQTTTTDNNLNPNNFWKALLQPQP